MIIRRSFVIVTYVWMLLSFSMLGMSIVHYRSERAFVEKQHQEWIADKQREIDAIVARSKLPTPLPFVKPIECILMDHARGKDLAMANYRCNQALDRLFHGSDQ